MKRNWLFIALLPVILCIGVAQGQKERADVRELEPPVAFQYSLGMADAVIYSDDIMASRYLNVLDMIQGRVAGVMVTGGPGFYRVRIRGAFNPPLVIIDGMYFRSIDDNDFNSLMMMIPPNDVDYIEIMKTPGAAALFPSAGNGVIVIHTRTGGEME